ncbi:MAG: hypothetical protein ACE5KF_01120 [Kiloniellaceae bacterium]
MRESLRLTLDVAPAKLPVTLNEAKAQLRLEDDQSADDAVVMADVRAATEACETFTGRALITQTWTLFRDDWPKAADGDSYWEGWRQGAETTPISPRRALELPKPPLQSVVHVKTYDDSNVATIYAATNYFVDAASEPGRIVLRKSAAAPIPTRSANGVEVQFKAGYGDTYADVPEPLRQGLLRLVAYLHENRGDCTDQALAEAGAGQLWQRYRVPRL